MKKSILILAIFLLTQLSFAGEIDSILASARNHESNKNYTEAIKEYKKYLNSPEAKNLKEVHIEIANCYFKANDKDKAVKYIEDAISKHGFTEEEFIYSATLDENLSKYALARVYDNYFKLRDKYLATLN